MTARGRRSTSRRRASRGRRLGAAPLPPVSADLRLVPGRHDLRAEREGHARVGAAPQGSRDLRLADGADVDRGERRLVAARRGADGAHAAGKEIVVSAGGVPTQPGVRKVTIKLPRPGDVRSQGLAADPDPRLVVARASAEPGRPRRSHAEESAPARRQAALLLPAWLPSRSDVVRGGLADRSRADEEEPRAAADRRGRPRSSRARCRPPPPGPPRTRRRTAFSGAAREPPSR